MNIINGIPITVAPVVPNKFTNIVYAASMPVSIPLDTLVIYKNTLWRGLRNGELAFVNAETPIPVKGYLEFAMMKSSPEFYMTSYINDFGFDFQITNISPGVYVLARMGNLAIVPISGDPNITLYISPYADGNTYSFSWKFITLGPDTGKIQITILKNEPSANTPSNVWFSLLLTADFSLMS